jgi:hypothetical protein
VLGQSLSDFAIVARDVRRLGTAPLPQPTNCKLPRHHRPGVPEDWGNSSVGGHDQNGDKRPEDATTLRELIELYQQQSQRGLDASS